VVPLGLRLAALTGPRAGRLLRVARLVQPAGAVATIASFLMPVRTAAGVRRGRLAVCVITSLAGLLQLIDLRMMALALCFALLGFAGWTFA